MMVQWLRIHLAKQGIQVRSVAGTKTPHKPSLSPSACRHERSSMKNKESVILQLKDPMHLKKYFQNVFSLLKIKEKQYDNICNIILTYQFGQLLKRVRISKVKQLGKKNFNVCSFILLFSFGCDGPSLLHTAFQLEQGSLRWLLVIQRRLQACGLSSCGSQLQSDDLVEVAALSRLSYCAHSTRDPPRPRIELVSLALKADL